MDPWGKSKRKRIVETAKDSGNPPLLNTPAKECPFFYSHKPLSTSPSPGGPRQDAFGTDHLFDRCPHPSLPLNAKPLTFFFLAASTSAWSGWHGSLTAAPMPRRLKKSTRRNASALRQKRAQWRYPMLLLLLLLLMSKTIIARAHAAATYAHPAYAAA